jgi:hypothetical protein
LWGFQNFESVKRTANEARQAGERNKEDGVHDIPLNFLQVINEWCVKDGRKEAIFACAYSIQNWNLAC